MPNQRRILTLTDTLTAIDGIAMMSSILPVSCLPLPLRILAAPSNQPPSPLSPEGLSKAAEGLLAILPWSMMPLTPSAKTNIIK